MTTIDALVEAALKRAFVLGQTYWQQADSDFTSHHKKAEATRQNFLVVCEETLAALAQARAEQAEPFGYVSEHNCEGPFKFQFQKTWAEVYKDNCNAITAFYTTPPAAPVAKLEPLDAMLVIDGIVKSKCSLGGGEFPDVAFVKGVRFAEAAHNAKLGASPDQ